MGLVWERGIDVGSMWDWWDCDYKIPPNVGSMWDSGGINVGLPWDQSGTVGSMWDNFVLPVKADTFHH